MMKCVLIPTVAFFMLIGCGKQTSGKDNLANAKQPQVTDEKTIAPLCTITKAFEMTMPQGAKLIRLVADTTSNGESIIKLYTYDGRNLAVIDNKSSFSKVKLDDAFDVWPSKNGQTIKTRSKGPSGDAEDIVNKVLDGTGALLFDPKHGGISQISDDGQYVLIQLAEHPMEAIEMRDKNGNLLWTKGTHDCSVWDAKIIQNNLVLTTEHKKAEKKNYISVYDIKGDLQFSFPDIKPDIDYNTYTGGSIVTVTPGGIDNVIYIIDIDKHSITTKDSTNYDLTDLSADGKYCILGFRDTLVCWQVSNQKELWKFADTKGRGKISPSGKWFAVFTPVKSKDDKNIKLVDQTGKIACEMNNFSDFINDSTFYYQDKDKIIFNTISR